MIELPRMSRRSAVVALAAGSIGTACRALDVDRSGDEPLDAVAERYVRCTLQLAQHQPSLVEAWLGPDSWRPGPRRPVAEIRAEIDDSREMLAALPLQGDAPTRHHYLRQQLDALTVAARRLAGESMSFAAEARASLGNEVGDLVDRLELYDTTAPHEEALEAARTTLEQRLPGTGPIHERYAAFRRLHAVSPQRILPAVQAAVAVCRRGVVREMSLPDTESVDVEAATALGLEARASYIGAFRTLVGIDVSGPTDLARVLWLAAHETYPGHHVQHVLADRDLVASHGWRERALMPAFGRHLLCSEGAAEAGAALLFDGGTFESACRELANVSDTPLTNAGDLVAVHRAVAQLDIFIAGIARAYLDGAIGSDAAAEQLTTRALVMDARQLLFAIERQRTRILAYPVGRRLVETLLNSAPLAERWNRLADIATTLTLTAV